VRIFKTKGVGRFAWCERIADASLREAIERAEHGIIDADLGGGLIKQRLEGRSGGFRMIVAYRAAGRAVFLYGFSKNALDNIEDDQLHDLRIIGAAWLAASDEIITQALNDGDLQDSTMTTTKKPDRLSREIAEMAGAQRCLGIMDEATYQKITVRHLGPDALPTAEPITPAEVRAVREQAHLSQAAFARYLNMTVSYVSQLERGVTQAKGPALALLNVIRRKGIGALS